MKYFLLSSALILSACSATIGTTTSQRQYTLSYDYTENNCPTGKHEFVSGSEEETKRQMCEALQNNALNKGCAEDMRRTRFNAECSGYRWNPKIEDNAIQSLDLETETMLGQSGSLTWLTLTKITGVGDFCSQVKFEEEAEGQSAYSTSDEGVAIICDKDNGHARFLFCTGEGCELEDTKFTIRSNQRVDGFKKTEFTATIKGASAIFLSNATKALKDQQFISSNNDQTRVKLKCSATSCTLDVLIYFIPPK